MDRFLIRIEIGYPTREQEVDVLTRQTDHHPLDDVRPVVTPEEIIRLQVAAHHVRVTEALKHYIVEIVSGTRRHAGVSVGASPRGSLGLFQAARAWAVLHSRDYCIPDDIKVMAVPVLAHRILLDGSHHIRSDRAVVEEILATVPVPVID
jgi:MoxR-like ATPase